MRRATPSGSEKKARAASSVSLRSHDATHDSYDGTESVNWLRKRLEDSNPDLLRRMVGRFADSLMAAGVKSLRCADSGQGSTKRVSSPTDLAIDAAVEVYLTDRSTRRAQSVIHEMGIGRISTTQVAALTRSLNGVVADFRNRRLDGAPYTYLSLDAQARCHREGSRAVHAMPVVVRGLKPGGFFEMVGMPLSSRDSLSSSNCFSMPISASRFVKPACSSSVTIEIPRLWSATRCADSMIRPGLKTTTCRSAASSAVEEATSSTKSPRAVSNAIRFNVSMRLSIAMMCMRG